MWNYTPSSSSQTNPSNKKINKSISVIPFRDHRLNDSESSISALIPFVWKSTDMDYIPESHFFALYGALRSTDKQMPSGNCFTKVSTGGEFSPMFDFSSGLYEEIKATNIFSKTNYICDMDTVKSNYYITASIKEASIKSEYYTYGLSVLAPIVHIFGPKTSKYTMNLRIEMIVYDANKKAIFNKEYTAEPFVIEQTLYRTYGTMVYNKMIKDIYLPFIKDLYKIA
jgi:hypothetical protein